MRQSRNFWKPPGDKPRWTQSTSLGFMLYNAPFQWGSPTPLQHSPTDGREKGGMEGLQRIPPPWPYLGYRQPLLPGVG